MFATAGEHQQISTGKKRKQKGTGKGMFESRSPPREGYLQLPLHEATRSISTSPGRDASSSKGHSQH